MEAPTERRRRPGCDWVNREGSSTNPWDTPPWGNDTSMGSASSTSRDGKGWIYPDHPGKKPKRSPHSHQATQNMGFIKCWNPSLVWDEGTLKLTQLHGQEPLPLEQGAPSPIQRCQGMVHPTLPSSTQFKVEITAFRRRRMEQKQFSGLGANPNKQKEFSFLIP